MVVPRSICPDRVAPRRRLLFPGRTLGRRCGPIVRKLYRWTRPCFSLAAQPDGTPVPIFRSCPLHAGAVTHHREVASTPQLVNLSHFGPFLSLRKPPIQGPNFGQASPSPAPLPAIGMVVLEPCQGASSGTENHPAPNDPKLGRLRCARQGLVRVPESNTKYGGKHGNQGVRPRLDWGQVSVSPQGFPSEKNFLASADPGFTPLFTGQLFIVARRRFRGCPEETHVKLRRSGLACRPVDGQRLTISAWCRPILAGCSSHDRLKTDGGAWPYHARGPDVPRHHLGGLGVQLAGDKIPAQRTAAADHARRHRRGRGAP